MKVDLESLRESFWNGYDSYEPSRIEADVVEDMFHNRQWDEDSLNTLATRGQPAETFNVIKLFSRMLIGYYSTVVNTVIAKPKQASDATIATVLTDTIGKVFEDNYMDIEGDKIKMSCFLSGLMICRTVPVFTGQRDQYGRPIYKIVIAHVPDRQIILDPESTDENYEDARWLHRWKWVPSEVIDRAFGKGAKEKLTAFYNHLNIDEAEFDRERVDTYGRFKVFDSYLLVHSVAVDDNGRRWSVFWCGDVELQRKEITYRDVKWPYRVAKLYTSNRIEYYGIFREVIESQKAINQAIVKLQLMVNTQKAFVETTSVEDMDEFAAAFNRVNGVIPVRSLKGIKIENLARDAMEQYAVIDKAFDRIQRILAINDSFLGMAFASDSGRKVKLQQSATIMALRYLTVRIEGFYRLLGMDVARLIRQYYTANQVLRITDEIVGQRFVELNKPVQIFSGSFDQYGQPLYETMYEKVLNPETGKPEITEAGDYIFAPIPEAETEVAFADVDIDITTAVFNDEDERSQLMVETLLSGSVGQMMAQVNPQGFFKMAGLTVRSFKTKYSPEISKIIEDTATMLSKNPEADQAAATIAGDIKNTASQKSKTLKLPTNTNEAI